jgi:hypothetical protein
MDGLQTALDHFNLDGVLLLIVHSYDPIEMRTVIVFAIDIVQEILNGYWRGIRIEFQQDFAGICAHVDPNRFSRRDGGKAQGSANSYLAEN